MDKGSGSMVGDEHWTASKKFERQERDDKCEILERLHKFMKALNLYFILGPVELIPSGEGKVRKKLRDSLRVNVQTVRLHKECSNGVHLEEMAGLAFPEDFEVYIRDDCWNYLEDGSWKHKSACRILAGTEMNHEYDKKQRDFVPLGNPTFEIASADD